MKILELILFPSSLKGKNLHFLAKKSKINSPILIKVIFLNKEKLNIYFF